MRRELARNSGFHDEDLRTIIRAMLAEGKEKVEALRRSFQNWADTIRQARDNFVSKSNGQNCLIRRIDAGGDTVVIKAAGDALSLLCQKCGGMFQIPLANDREDDKTCPLCGGKEMIPWFVMPGVTHKTRLEEAIIRSVLLPILNIVRSVVVIGHSGTWDAVISNSLVDEARKKGLPLLIICGSQGDESVNEKCKEMNKPCSLASFCRMFSQFPGIVFTFNFDGLETLALQRLLGDENVHRLDIISWLYPRLVAGEEVEKELLHFMLRGVVSCSNKPFLRTEFCYMKVKDDKGGEDLSEGQIALSNLYARKLLQARMEQRSQAGKGSPYIIIGKTLAFFQEKNLDTDTEEIPHLCADEESSLGDRLWSESDGEMSQYFEEFRRKFDFLWNKVSELAKKLPCGLKEWSCIATKAFWVDPKALRNPVDSRENHCLGCGFVSWFLTKRILDKKGIEEGHDLRKRLESAAALAGFIHDISHFPLSHLADEAFYFLQRDPDFRKVKFSHDERRQQVLEELLNKLSKESGRWAQDLEQLIKFVAKVCDGSSPLVWLDTILDAPVDADKIDYIFRDRSYLERLQEDEKKGLKKGSVLSPIAEPGEWLKQFGDEIDISPVGHLVIRFRGASLVRDLLYLRHWMYKNFYKCPEFHVLETIEGALLARWFVYKRREWQLGQDASSEMLKKAREELVEYAKQGQGRKEMAVMFEICSYLCDKYKDHDPLVMAYKKALQTRKQNQGHWHKTELRNCLRKEFSASVLRVRAPIRANTTDITKVVNRVCEKWKFGGPESEVLVDVCMLPPTKVPKKGLVVVCDQREGIPVCRLLEEHLEGMLQTEFQIAIVAVKEQEAAVSLVKDRIVTAIYEELEVRATEIWNL